MGKELRFLLVSAILLFSIISVSSQNYYPCGGDKQLSLMCPSQTQEPQSNVSAQNSHVGLGVVTFIILLGIIGGCGFVGYKIIKKRKKK